MKGVQCNRGYERPLNGHSGLNPLADRRLNGEAKDNPHHINDRMFENPDDANGCVKDRSDGVNSHDS
jgi:hypothetical protein